MENQTFFSSNRLIIKGLLIGFLILILLVPTFFIHNLISERRDRKKEAEVEVSAKWGGMQTIRGPIIKVPFYRIHKNEKGSSSRVLDARYITPADLNLRAEVDPQKRKRGIFEIMIYQSDLKMSGNFTSLLRYFSDVAEGDVLWSKAELILGISDLRGLQQEASLSWNSSKLQFSKTDLINPEFGSSLIAELPDFSPKEPITFAIELKMKGSEKLNFVPIGKRNKIFMRSSWENPSFQGAFLPDTHIINKKGFTAEWTISHLNRNIPGYWGHENFPDLPSTQFGVSLVNPNDHYQKSERVVKYAILIIALTFLGFFLVEVMQKQKVHPFQYILIGLALCVFYALLVSFSEFIHFNLAYGISGLMTIGLIAWYTQSVLLKTQMAVGAGLLLTLLYTFIFVIIQLQDTALLIGSLGLFLILLLTMFATRKIDWYNE